MFAIDQPEFGEYPSVVSLVTNHPAIKQFFPVLRDKPLDDPKNDGSQTTTPNSATKKQHPIYAKFTPDSNKDQTTSQEQKKKDQYFSPSLAVELAKAEMKTEKEAKPIDVNLTSVPVSKPLPTPPPKKEKKSEEGKHSECVSSV